MQRRREVRSLKRATGARFREGVEWGTLLYPLLLLLWFGLRLSGGDRVWWSALLSSFTPYLFLPLLLLLPWALLTDSPRLRLAAFIPAACFVLLYGRLYLPGAHLLSGADAALSVMTFNIWGGSGSAETVQVVAAARYPDLVALQELTPEMAEVFVAEVGAVYPHRLLAPQGGPDGMGLLSRYPMEEVAIAGLPGTVCRVQAARVTTPDGVLVAYNVHPDSSNVLVYLDRGIPLAEATRESGVQREACVRAVVADLQARHEPVVVLGDFNATDQSDLYRLLRRHLRDAHRDAGWGLGHTFPAYGGSFRGIPIPPREMRIDMVFTNDALRALSCRVSAAYGESDHRPVIADLAWR